MPHRHVTCAATPWAGSLRRSRLLRTALYVLLFMTLECFSDQLHAPEQSFGGQVAVSRDAPLSMESFERVFLDAPDSPDRCPDPGHVLAVFAQSPARARPVAVAASSVRITTHAFVPETAGAAPSGTPSGGRSALTGNSRWRI